MAGRPAGGRLATPPGMGVAAGTLGGGAVVVAGGAVVTGPVCGAPAGGGACSPGGGGAEAAVVVAWPLGLVCGRSMSSPAGAAARRRRRRISVPAANMASAPTVVSPVTARRGALG